jgi:TrmH family RNA methyltransferase
MLTSLQNPLIKQIRKLHQAKVRREQQLFLLEGTHLLEAACEANRSFVTVCCTPEWQIRYPALWQRMEQRAQRLELVSTDVLKAISTTVEPDGIVATLEHTSPPIPQFTSLGLILETIQDPGNLGTIIRTATAVGADGILLSKDSVDLEHPKVLRASAGQWFQLPMATSINLKAEIIRYQQTGMQIIASSPTASLNYWQIDLQKPSLVLLGNEGAGLSSDLASLAAHEVSIPLNPGVESLNVAISAALILYEATRQRRSSNISN